MFNPPRTVDEAHAYRYGQWSGNPDGDAFRDHRCAYEIAAAHGALFRQCLKPPTTGRLYCAVHARRVDAQSLR